VDPPARKREDGQAYQHDRRKTRQGSPRAGWGLGGHYCEFRAFVRGATCLAREPGHLPKNKLLERARLLANSWFYAGKRGCVLSRIAVAFLGQRSRECTSGFVAFCEEPRYITLNRFGLLDRFAITAISA
jgi:hypothetical protein